MKRLSDTHGILACHLAIERFCEIQCSWSRPSRPGQDLSACFQKPTHFGPRNWCSETCSAGRNLAETATQRPFFVAQHAQWKRSSGGLTLPGSRPLLTCTQFVLSTVVAEQLVAAEYESRWACNHFEQKTETDLG